MDIFSPQAAAVTGYVSQNHRSDTMLQIYSGIVNNANVYDGITLFPGAGTVSGTVRIYGYRN